MYTITQLYIQRFPPPLVDSRRLFPPSGFEAGIQPKLYHGMIF